MNTKDKIIKFLKNKENATGREILELLGITRQALNKHIKKLIQEGLLEKVGSTIDAKYKAVSFSKGKRIKKETRFKRKYFLSGLEEHNVFNEIMLLLNLRKALKENVFNIINYAFTEMLNNAIEHSQSQVCGVEFIIDEYNCGFKIRDYGIGIFHSIYEKFNLSDETAAIGELVKGKTTTMKEKHSGEGIFFTSKVGNNIIIRSHRLSLSFDNVRKDIFVEVKRYMKGTFIDFCLSKNSSKKLEEIFKQYAPEEFDYKFEKTKVYVKLFQDKYISRSEGKRLLSGLEKFKEIILDFKGVKSIGQGFSDEVFRVFKKQHPDIVIKTENLNQIIQQTINHVVDNNI